MGLAILMEWFNVDIYLKCVTCCIRFEHCVEQDTAKGTVHRVRSCGLHYRQSLLSYPYSHYCFIWHDLLSPFPLLHPSLLTCLTPAKHSLIPVAGPAENGAYKRRSRQEVSRSGNGPPGTGRLGQTWYNSGFRPGNCDKFSRGIVHSIHFYAISTECPFVIYSRETSLL